MQVQIIGNVVSAVIKLSLIFLFSAELIYFIYAYVFDILLISLGYLIVYKNQELNIFNWNFDKKLAKKLLGLSWPLIISGIMVSDAFISTKLTNSDFCQIKSISCPTASLQNQKSLIKF